MPPAAARGRRHAGFSPADREPYGGPASSLWQPLGRRLLFDELLAQHGFAVLHATIRYGGRGRAFAQAAYHNFGPVQLRIS